LKIRKTVDEVESVKAFMRTRIKEKSRIGYIAAFIGGKL
jgi:hypothetical protein